MKLATLYKARFVGAALMVMFGSSVADQVARAENWPQWRGAKHNGISGEANIPTKWSKTENIAWRLPLPGPGGATPVVWGRETCFCFALERTAKRNGGKRCRPETKMCVAMKGTPLRTHHAPTASMYGQ